MKLKEYLLEVQGRVDATKGNDLDSWVDFEEHARQDVELLLEIVNIFLNTRVKNNEKDHVTALSMAKEIAINRINADKEIEALIPKGGER